MIFALRNKPTSYDKTTTQINPSKTISKAIKRVKKITETRGRGLSNEQECAAIAFSIFFLTGSGQACEGQDINLESEDDEFPDFTTLCGSCMDALEDIFTQLNNKGCFDDDECDFEELEHEGVCVEDCSTDSSVCDTDDTCQNGKCLPADGSDPEEEDSEAIITIFQYACVKHPDGAYCYDKATFFFQGAMSDCSDFDGVGCCYGWLKKRASFDFSLSYLSISNTKHIHNSRWMF